MKRVIFTAILAMLYTVVFAQNEAVQIHNFILKNGEVFWQKTYENIDSTICNEYFKEKPFINSNECHVTLANYSTKRAMSRAFVLNEPCIITFSLQVKEDRYRITISNIVFESSTTVGIGFGSGVAVGNTTKNYYDLKFYAFNKKGKITFKEGGIIPKQMDEALSLLFDATKNQHGKEHSDILNSEF